MFGKYAIYSVKFTTNILKIISSIILRFNILEMVIYIDKIIEDYGITDVLFLYNASTFLADNSIADVLAESEAENGQEESQGTQEDSQENTQGAQEDGQENTQATQGESQDNTQGTQENGQDNAQGDQGETQDDTQSE